jgi:non-specific serine/threonine protein kinase
MNFVGVPSCYPKLLELRKSKTADFKANKYLRPETKLRYYQVVGALHMMMLDRMVLGDGTGLGKTIELIGAYSFLLSNDPTLKLLVVCQKSALFQWAEEFDKFTTGISVRAITNDYRGVIGPEARMLQYQDFKENVLIMNYNPVVNEYETVMGILKPNYMVCFDECTAFKNRKTQTFMACKFISESARRAYGLSATIIKNGLEEVYCIYDVVVPGVFGKITKFKDTYCNQKLMKIVQGGKTRYFPKIIGYKNLAQFKTTLDPYFLIRRKEEVASELPKLISKKVVLEMLPEQKELYRKALAGILYEEKTKQEYFEVMDQMRLGQTDAKTQQRFKDLKEKYDRFSTEEGKKRGKLAAITYCQMISNGPALVNEPGDSSKEEEFIRLMTEELSSDKVILFTRFKSGIPSLEIWCERKGIKYTRITGDENDRERQEARIKFQTDPTCNLIFITTAGSSSLNLQAASCLIFYDTPWSYGDLVQTIGRAQRIGSLRDHILILHLVNKGTVDVRVINRVTDKKDLSDEILGDTAQGALEFTANENKVVDDLYTELLKDAEGL